MTAAAAARAATPVVAFLDFRKAFDSVSHAAIRDALETLMVDRGVLQLIMDHVENARVRVLTAHGMCPPIRATQQRECLKGGFSPRSSSTAASMLHLPLQPPPAGWECRLMAYLAAQRASLHRRTLMTGSSSPPQLTT